ncbi:hypothetical protein FKM82_018580 [Ascaphus truei]
MSPRACRCGRMRLSGMKGGTFERMTFVPNPSMGSIGMYFPPTLMPFCTRVCVAASVRRKKMPLPYILLAATTAKGPTTSATALT